MDWTGALRSAAAAPWPVLHAIGLKSCLLRALEAPKKRRAAIARINSTTAVIAMLAIHLRFRSCGQKRRDDLLGRAFNDAP
jgi:hypothetical protein